VNDVKSFSDIARDGLWRQNPGFVQLLGLCPLLATSSSVINGLGMGLATIFVLTASNLAISLVRGAVRPEVRIPLFVLIIAGLVTTVELVMQAWFPGLHRVLGLFVALIVTNCIVIGRAEAYAARADAWRATADGLLMGLGFTLVLVMLGALRELVGHGTLLADATLLFGPVAADWTLHLPGYRGLLLAVLPPGAFIGLGLLVALKNWIDARLAARAIATPAGQPAISA
jgi:electron transport complex protein RnfE